VVEVADGVAPRLGVAFGAVVEVRTLEPQPIGGRWVPKSQSSPEDEA
jgi:hypothetical protein